MSGRFMSIKAFCFILFTMISQSVWGISAINDMRIGVHQDKTRLVLETSTLLSYQLIPATVKNNIRLTFPENIQNNVVFQQLKHRLPTPQGLIKGIKLSPNPNSKKLVIDIKLKNRSEVRHFTLKPSAKHAYRLVFDFIPSSGSQSSQPVTPILKDIIIAIDAGHGGKDPGAIGPSGTQEKKIVLSIARRLKKRIDQQPGMQAVMIRQGNEYLSLAKRLDKARKFKANAFISIHADAFKNPKAKGASVFIVSKKGATSESAKWLAAKENSVDLIGGASINKKESVLAGVIFDMVQTATIMGSDALAKNVLKQLKEIGKIHKKKVERAGFVVLKSPDIPSILVETGFISNPQEEKKLRSSLYQEKVAKAIFLGLDKYFTHYPLANTIYAQRQKNNEG